jgi:F-type H+-transporting ATPase subunit b
MAGAHLTPVAASSGSFLIKPNVGLMVWTLLLFGISMYVLYKLAFPRITQALDKRQHMIEESIDHADKIRHEADELLAEYRERLQAARRQADEIIDRARKAADTREHESEEEAHRRREELMERARRDIEIETQRSIQEIRREVADLTVLATERVTRKVLTPEDQRRLLDEALQELDFAALSPGSEN